MAAHTLRDPGAPNGGVIPKRVHTSRKADLKVRLYDRIEGLAKLSGGASHPPGVLELDEELV